MDKTTLLSTILVFIIFSTGLYIGSLQPSIVFELGKVLLGSDGIQRTLTIYDKILMFIHIFIRNTVVSILNISLGPLYGIFPIFTLLFNGFLIGGVMAEVSNKFGWEFALLGIAPHGIFELPAFLYSAILGLKLSLYYSRELHRGNIDMRLFQESIEKLIRIIIPLLLIAAFIETFITLSILGG
jgi:stage II sporulation protein M